MPKVSIILRLKNEEELLPQALNALCKQTFEDFEIIAVDNESTDKTKQILDSFKNKLSIKVINLPANKFNYVYACNLGAQHSTGEIIGYLSGHSIPILNNYISRTLWQRPQGMGGTHEAWS
jgi:rhamnosyltransferase